jgi:glycosyltransferase involved in cell wall biosynthesis
MTITAIIPAYNNEVSIGTQVLITKKYANHVIVVDDGSTDRTVKVAQLAGAEIIQHPMNRGKGAAIKSGFEYVKRNGARVIVTLDSQGHNDPDQIPKFIYPILNGETDVVKSSRCVMGKKTSKDTQIGIHAFARHTLPAFRFGSNGHTTESEMLKDAENAGFRIMEVEIPEKQDIKEAKNNSPGVINTLVKLLEDIELNKPLYYLTVPGILCTVLGLGLGLNFLKNFLLGEGLRFGPTLFMILLTIIGSFMAFSGIILHTMSRLINENRIDKKVSKGGAA